MRLTGIKHFNIHILEVCAYSFILLIVTPFLFTRAVVPLNICRYNRCEGGKSIYPRVLKSSFGNIIQTRLFSVSINLSASSAIAPKPAVIYKNAGVDVERILLENKGKTGVYC